MDAGHQQIWEYAAQLDEARSGQYVKREGEQIQSLSVSLSADIGEYGVEYLHLTPQVEEVDGEPLLYLRGEPTHTDDRYSCKLWRKAGASPPYRVTLLREWTAYQETLRGVQNPFYGSEPDNPVTIRVFLTEESVEWVEIYTRPDFVRKFKRDVRVPILFSLTGVAGVERIEIPVSDADDGQQFEFVFFDGRHPWFIKEAIKQRKFLVDRDGKTETAVCDRDIFEAVYTERGQLPLKATSTIWFHWQRPEKPFERLYNTNDVKRLHIQLPADARFRVRGTDISANLYDLDTFDPEEDWRKLQSRNSSGIRTSNNWAMTAFYVEERDDFHRIFTPVPRQKLVFLEKDESGWVGDASARECRWLPDAEPYIERNLENKRRP